LRAGPMPVNNRNRFRLGLVAGLVLGGGGFVAAFAGGRGSSPSYLPPSQNADQEVQAAEVLEAARGASPLVC